MSIVVGAATVVLSPASFYVDTLFVGSKSETLCTELGQCCVDLEMVDHRKRRLSKLLICKRVQ